MDRAGTRIGWRRGIDTRLGIVKSGGGTADGFVAEDMVDGGIYFEDECWEKQVGAGVIAGEIATFRHFSVAT